MPKVLSQSSTGQRIVTDSYFANFKTLSPLGALYEPSTVRSPAPKIVYVTHGKLRLEAVTFTHLLKVVTDLPNPVLSNNLLTMAIANDVTIDGVDVETGDLLEMSRPLAVALGVSPGTWKFDNKRSMTLLNPPKYVLNGLYSSIGMPWRYRTDDNGDLIGLAPVAASGTSVVNNSTAIKNMGRLLDSNFYSYVDASDASNQSSTLKFTAIEHVRKMALRATSAKTNYENRIPNAQFGIQDQNASPLGSLFINCDTGVRQSNGQTVWARGAPVEYYSDVMDRTFSAITLNDAGNARSYASAELLLDLPSQINIKGEIPTAGSIITITEDIAASFKPAVAAGDYLVVENSGSLQWRIRKI